MMSSGELLSLYKVQTDHGTWFTNATSKTLRAACKRYTQQELSKDRKIEHIIFVYTPVICDMRFFRYATSVTRLYT